MLEDLARVKEETAFYAAGGGHAGRHTLELLSDAGAGQKGASDVDGAEQGMVTRLLRIFQVGGGKRILAYVGRSSTFLGLKLTEVHVR